MPQAIPTHGSRKNDDALRALNGPTREAPQSEAFGFLSPNGAGTATTIRLLLELIRPTAGTPGILGFDSRGTEHRSIRSRRLDAGRRSDA
jgi:ABC-2 type transport system ATP-binding protein